MQSEMSSMWVLYWTGGGMVGRPGFKPGLTESESGVLPLDDLPLTGVNAQYDSVISIIFIP